MGNASSMQNLLGAAASGAAIVLFGALYALLLALGRLHRHAALRYFATTSYLCLMASTAVLVHALDLHGPWLVVPAALLVGYLFAPHGVWRLCVAIHDDPHEARDRSREEAGT